MQTRKFLEVETGIAPEVALFFQIANQHQKVELSDVFQIANQHQKVDLSDVSVQYQILVEEVYLISI